MSQVRNLQPQDRRSECSGFWWKPEALLEMKREWMWEAILDSRNSQIGQALNELGDVDCPECGIILEKILDKEQEQVWCETRPKSSGLFLDAGEFVDLKYDTFAERVRGLVWGLVWGRGAGNADQDR